MHRQTYLRCCFGLSSRSLYTRSTSVFAPDCTYLGGRPSDGIVFCGFTLGVAAELYGLDKRLAAFALRSAGGSLSLFLLLIILITAIFLDVVLKHRGRAPVPPCLRPVLKHHLKDYLGPV